MLVRNVTCLVAIQIPYILKTADSKRVRPGTRFAGRLGLLILEECS
jgi:hypothetical protein